MNNFTTFNDFFDHIYVITLARATERQRSISNNLTGLAYEFFIGADKQEYTIDDLIQKGIYDEVKAKKMHRYHKALNTGQICCAWSHKLVYEDMLEKGYQKILILEDDVKAIERINSTSEMVLSELPQDWDLVYFDYSKNEQQNILKQYWYHVQRALGALTWNHTTIQNLYPKKISPHLSTSGYHDYTSAYAITANAAKIILQLQTPVIYLADNLLANACTTKKINGYISHPKLFSQDSQGSGKLTHSFVDD